MVLLLRTLLVWCMVLLVPAQGSAAVARAFCASGHPAGKHTPVPSHRHASVAEAPSSGHAGHSEAHALHPGSGQAHPAHTPAASAHGQPAAGDTQHADTHGCSACAACCSVGALLSQVVGPPPPGLVPTVFAEFVPSVDDFAANGLERPPRIPLA